MTFKEFIKKYNGKYVDYDHSEGYQCWDLAQLYFTEVLNLPPSILNGCGNVKNMLKGKKRKLMDKYFDEVSNPSSGDVAIWSYGHIAIYDYTGKVSHKNYYFSQNPNPCEVIQINRSGVYFFHKKDNSFLPARGYFMKGDKSDKIGKIASFMYKNFPLYTSKKALGNYFGPYLEQSIKEFQRRTNLKSDGCIGPKTLSMLKKYGFKE